MLSGIIMGLKEDCSFGRICRKNYILMVRKWVGSVILAFWTIAAI